MAGDAVVIALTLVIAHSIRFGDSATTLASSDNIPYWQVGVVIGLMWFIAFAIWRAWEIRILASGAVEYRRVVNATLAFFGALAIIAYVFEIELARGYVAVAIPVGALLLLVWRWLARQVVAVTASGLSPRHMRALSWRLADHSISLILAPALMDIAGPRMHSHPVADLPLIHVSTPRLGGFSAVLKRAFDIGGSAAGLLLVSPLMLAVAIAIKTEDGGSVFFHQTRIGKDNEPFSMIKFRSMVVDAEARLDALQDGDEGNGVLFKMRDAPGSPGWDSSSAATRSTSCRSSSTCCADQCRWWVRGRR